MTFDGVTKFRSINVYAGLLGYCVLTAFLIAAGTWAAWIAAAVVGSVSCFFLWGVATNKTCRLQVANGVVTWDAPRPWLPKQSFPVSDIEAVLINVDDNYDVRLRLNDGRTEFVPLAWPLDQERFIQAIAAESPAISVEQKHLGRVSSS